jgi:diguanylate cyclase (GGDEF)-like protein
MTLYKQISASIVMLLVICFAGTVYISTGNLKKFLATQLDAHAQDTATSLGLSISPHMKANDLTVVETMIDAIFNRGVYQKIELVSTSGETLIKKTADISDAGVPQWFIDAVALQVPAAEALVMSGWRQAGSIHVTSNPGNAHRELWSNTIDTFWLFLGCTIAILALGLLALKLLLQPLRKVEMQANAICNRNYLVQNALPRTRELRRVVIAMNRLSEKVGAFFTEQSRLTEKLREQSYRDPLTGLGNRRYFNRQLETLLKSHEGPTQGALLMLELQDLAKINETSGFVNGDKILSRMAELIEMQTRQLDNCFAYRISGAGFGIVATSLASESADALAATLCQGMLQLRADGLVESNNIGHIGIAMWQQTDTLSNLLSEADIALRAAQACGQNTWQRYAPPAANQAEIFGAGHWYKHLRKCLDSRDIILEQQPVYGTGNNAKTVLHHEILSRIPDSSGNGITASIFMPMAERLNLASELDKLAVGKLLTHLGNNGDTDCYALNLSAGALHDAGFIQWLCEQLERNPSIAKRLLIEFPEYTALINIQNVRDLVERLGALGCRCGIDHFGTGFYPFGYLRSLHVSYLKVDGSYTRNIDTEKDNQFFIKALTDTAHSIDIDVIAQAVETPAERAMLESINVDGIQGYLAAKPVQL